MHTSSTGAGATNVCSAYYYDIQGSVFVETAINSIRAFYSRDAQGSPLAVIHGKISHDCSNAVNSELQRPHRLTSTAPASWPCLRGSSRSSTRHRALVRMWCTNLCGSWAWMSATRRRSSRASTCHRAWARMWCSTCRGSWA